MLIAYLEVLRSLHYKLSSIVGRMVEPPTEAESVMFLLVNKAALRKIVMVNRQIR